MIFPPESEAVIVPRPEDIAQAKARIEETIRSRVSRRWSRRDAHAARVLLAALCAAETRLGEPTLQCAECGSTGPFRDIVYPNTPNGPEEYDTECVECNSRQVAESPRCAFTSMQNRLDTRAAEAEVRAEKAERLVAEPLGKIEGGIGGDE